MSCCVKQREWTSPEPAAAGVTVCGFCGSILVVDEVGVARVADDCVLATLSDVERAVLKRMVAITHKIMTGQEPVKA